MGRRIGSLFSGAGGLDLAVQEVFGGDVVWHAEIEKAASKVLAYRFPGVPNLGDISAVDWADVPAVDVLCGGFPCQDVSAAGRRAGIKDGTRSGLWSVFADAIDALRPQWVVIENVRGLLSATAHRTVDDADSDVEPAAGVMGDGAGRPVLRAAGAVLGDLADLGYDAQWATVAAADVGAPHRRERVFILATDASSGELQRRGIPRVLAGAAADAKGRVWDAASSRGQDAAVSGDQLGVALLPTPNAQDGNGGKTPRGGSPFHNTGTKRQVPLTDLPDLLPTPNASDGSGGGQHPDKREGHSRQLIDYILLCTPTAQPGTSRSGSRIGEPLLNQQAREMSTAWGKYEPAIRRWEQIAGSAPAPTEPNKNGNPRLSAAFSEWLMGWPQGWVTHPDIGISRNDQLRIVGNGVCPQQAIAALNFLLAVSEVTA